MVQEGEDGGWARVGAAAGEEWLVLAIFSGVSFPLLTSCLFLGPTKLCGALDPTHSQGVGPDNLPWNPNFNP